MQNSTYSCNKYNNLSKIVVGLRFQQNPQIIMIMVYKRITRIYITFVQYAFDILLYVSFATSYIDSIGQGHFSSSLQFIIFSEIITKIHMVFHQKVLRWSALNILHISTTNAKKTGNNQNSKSNTSTKENIQKLKKRH